MSISQNLQVQIRPDILDIGCIDLTLAGKIWLMGFSLDAVNNAVDVLSKAPDMPKMREKAKWYVLSSECIRYSEDNNIHIDWKTVYQLLEDNGLNIKSPMIEEKKNQEKSKPKKEYTREQWKDAPLDRIAYAHQCHDFEVNREEGSLKYNPFWAYMYPTWKKRMIAKFPILREVYPKDAMFCDGLNDIPDMKHANPQNDYENAENIIVYLEGTNNIVADTLKLLPGSLQYNPWFERLEMNDKIDLLTKYPWYAPYVSKIPQAGNYWDNYARAIKVMNETYAQKDIETFESE